MHGTCRGLAEMTPVIELFTFTVTRCYQIIDSFRFSMLFIVAKDLVNKLRVCFTNASAKPFCSILSTYRSALVISLTLVTIVAKKRK